MSKKEKKNKKIIIQFKRENSSAHRSPTISLFLTEQKRNKFRRVHLTDMTSRENSCVQESSTFPPAHKMMGKPSSSKHSFVLPPPDLGPAKLKRNNREGHRCHTADINQQPVVHIKQGNNLS